MVLTFKARRALPASDFALPGRRYPIHDQAHALQALRQMGHATPAERALIEKRVYARYPALRPMEKEAGLDFLGLLAKKVGAGSAGDAMIRAHKGAGDAVEGGVRRALNWEVPGTRGIHLPGATPERRAKAVDWLAKTSRMAVEDPELGALILAPVPGTDVAAFGLKKAKDGLRRRLGLLPELPKTAEAGEKFGGQLRLALTAEDRTQLADLKRRADASGFSAVRTSQGVAVYTHRARTAYYPSFDKIPVARARFIDSTG